VLYHYTSASGLRGILESGVLWATNILYLNDSSELSYATALLTRIFETEARKHTAGAKTLLSILVPKLIEFMPMDFFVACFCESEDLLSQWRAYASRGIGYSLGFETKHLTSAISRQDHTVGLCKIQYDSVRQELILKQCLEVVAQSAASLFSDVEMDVTTIPFLQIVARSVARTLATLIASLKHPSFAEEKEWRIVSFGVRPTAQLRFQARCRWPSTLY